MNIVFLIGNGFDLNLGLKTSYTHFFQCYQIVRGNDTREHIKTFLTKLSEKGDEWSNFEIALGKHAASFTVEQGEVFEDLWQDVHEILSRYISIQQNTVLARYVAPPSSQQHNTHEYLLHPERYIENALRPELVKFRDSFSPSHTKVDIINYNYSKTVEHIFGWGGGKKPLGRYGEGELQSVMHVHGTTDDDMLIGVDNKMQIEGDLREDINTQSIFIKPIANQQTLSLRDKGCIDCIKRADLICIFGMSIGETDKTWWHQIGERLRSPKTQLIIFARGKGVPASRRFMLHREREEWIKRFLDRAGVAEPHRNDVRQRITVSFNTSIFSLFANKIIGPDPIDTADRIIRSL